MMFKSLISFCALLAAVVSGFAGVVIDDFSVHPNNASATFSAPNLGRNPVFFRQTGLEASHVLGGARSASVQADSSIPVTFTFDAEKKQGVLTLDKLAAGRATLNYFGGSMGEARDLDTDFTKGGANAIAITFTKAPSSGTLLVTLNSGEKYQTIPLPIKDGAPLIFPFTAFPNIDFRHIDGVTVDIQITKAANKKFVYELARIETITAKTR